MRLKDSHKEIECELDCMGVEMEQMNTRSIGGEAEYFDDNFNESP